MAAKNEFLTTRIQKFTWDFSVDGGANNSAIVLGDLPDNALITKGWAHVVTKPVDSDAGDDQTISLGYTGAATAFMAATAISSLTAGKTIRLLPGVLTIGAGQAITTVDTAAEICAVSRSGADFGAIKLTADKRVLLTIADDVALTAGKIHVYIEYFIAD